MSIENLKKHVGQLSNTGVRVAVIFRKLPNDEKHCLIVETERLPDSYHDQIMQCLNSREAYETNEFYEVLNRRTFPDGTNCLTTLHTRGWLRKEPVSNVIMYPLPNQPVPLALINATIDKKLDQYMAEQKTANSPTVAETVANASQDKESIARGLIMQAELLERDAAAKREEAYTMVPELRPGRGRPALPEDIKEAKLEERKIKRRERDQRKAAEARENREQSAINEKVRKKLERDALVRS